MKEFNIPFFFMLIFCWLLSYLMVAFICWTFNPLDWGQVGRFFYLVLWIFSLIPAFSFSKFIKEGK